jgi:hypothetical protein
MFHRFSELGPTMLRKIFLCAFCLHVSNSTSTSAANCNALSGQYNEVVAAIVANDERARTPGQCDALDQNDALIEKLRNVAASIASSCPDIKLENGKPIEPVIADIFRVNNNTLKFACKAEADIKQSRLALFKVTPEKFEPKWQFRHPDIRHISSKTAIPDEHVKCMKIVDDVAIWMNDHGDVSGAQLAAKSAAALDWSVWEDKKDIETTIAGMEKNKTKALALEQKVKEEHLARAKENKDEQDREFEAELTRYQLLDAEANVKWQTALLEFAQCQRP